MTRIANVDQAAAWDGDEGAAWARHWERYDRSVAAYQTRMLEATAVVDGEQVLDIGCGNGQSTRDAARATPSGSALGVDLSSPMLERARRLAEAEGLPNASFAQGDAQVYPFAPGAFDLALSRFGAMFFADKVAAFSNIGRALRSGGRILLVVWQPIAVNEQFRTLFATLGAGQDLPTPPPGGPSPFGLADPALGRGCLEEAGFVDVADTDVRGEFHMGADTDDAYDFISQIPIARGLLEGLDDPTRIRALDELRAAIAAHDTGNGVRFPSATWFITARRP